MKVPAYRQQARAASTEATRASILDAVDEVLLPRPGRVFSLEEVAGRAGTTVQTVLRHFGTKAGLLEAASRRGLAGIQAGRDEVPVGDLGAVAAYLGRHCAQTSGMVLPMLAVEDQVPEVARITQQAGNCTGRGSSVCSRPSWKAIMCRAGRNALQKRSPPQGAPPPPRRPSSDYCQDLCQRRSTAHGGTVEGTGN